MPKVIAYVQHESELYELWPLISVGKSYAVIIPIGIVRFTATVDGRPVVMGRAITGGIDIRLISQQELDRLLAEMTEHGKEVESAEETIPGDGDGSSTSG